MLESLKEAFNAVAELPEDEQRYIVEIIKRAIASEKHWQTLFHDPGSERVLGDLEAEALAEDYELSLPDTFSRGGQASTSPARATTRVPTSHPHPLPPLQ